MEDKDLLKKELKDLIENEKAWTRIVTIIEQLSCYMLDTETESIIDIGALRTAWMYKRFNKHRIARRIRKAIGINS